MIDIKIRSIQHYLYCPHRWGLMEIDCAWAENYFVTKANIMHERVHNPDKSYTSRGKKVFTSIHVYNDEYGLYGVTDCIELIPDNSGISIDNTDKKYKLCIVEYKPSKPKNSDYREYDLMQIFAQKLCVDNIFKCDAEAVIYYADVKKRIKLPLNENFNEYDQKLKIIINEMHTYIENGIIPPKPLSQKCSGCSMKDICMPSRVNKKTKDFKQELFELNDLSV